MVTRPYSGMSRRSIDRRDWVSFVDGFSRRHRGWLISVTVEQPGAERQYISRDAPLRGVVAELRNAGTLMVFTGDTTPHSAHFVERPVSIEVVETGDGAEKELSVADFSGTRTVIEFRAPIRTE